MCRRISFDECQCSCHDDYSGIMHAMPCCIMCPTCKKNIRFGGWTKHTDDHIKNGPRMATREEDEWI